MPEDSADIPRIPVPPGAVIAVTQEAEKAFEEWWAGWLESTGYRDDRWQRDLVREAFLAGRLSMNDALATARNSGYNVGLGAVLAIISPEDLRMLANVLEGK